MKSNDYDPDASKLLKCSRSFENKFKEANPPPCVTNKKCNKYCEYSTFCMFTGRIGLQLASKYRGFIYSTTIVFSILGTIFICLGIVAMGHGYGQVKYFGWSHGKISKNSIITKDIDYYIGLNGYGFDDKYTSFGNSRCQEKFCKDCKDEATGIHTTLIFGLITQLLQLQNIIGRIKGSGDHNCSKFGSFFGEIMQVFSLFPAMALYNSSCRENFPDNIIIAGSKVDIEWSAGPGYILIVFGILVKAIVFVVQFSMPVPQENVQQKEEQEQDAKEATQDKYQKENNKTNDTYNKKQNKNDHPNKHIQQETEENL